MINVNTNQGNYQVGRGGFSVKKIYLHCTDKTAAQMLGDACLPIGSSYHYSVHGHNLVYKFVSEGDTALSFTAPANPPVVGKPVGATDNQATINIAIECLPLAEACSQIGYANGFLNTIGELICKVASDNGLALSDVVSTSVDIPLTTILAKATSCNNPTFDGVCFKPHESVSGMELPLAAWNGNCLVEQTVVGSVTRCNYTVDIPFASNLDALTSVMVGGVSYAPPTPLTLVSPINLITWLNGLGLGTWNVTYVNMALPGVVRLVLLSSDVTANSVTYSGGSQSFTSSGCVSGIGNIPVTLSTLLCNSLDATATAVSGAIVATPTTYVGEDNTRYLGRPMTWLKITCGGNLVGIVPVYRPV